MWRIKAAGESSLKGQLHKKQEFLTSRRTRTIIPANATLPYLFIYVNLPSITFLGDKMSSTDRGVPQISIAARGFCTM